MARRNAITELMNETILYGGLRATRKEAYDDAYAAVLSRGADEKTAAKCADMFAFGPRAVAVDPESVKHIPALREYLDRLAAVA